MMIELIFFEWATPLSGLQQVSIWSGIIKTNKSLPTVKLLGFNCQCRFQTFSHWSKNKSNAFWHHPVHFEHPGKVPLWRGWILAEWSNRVCEGVWDSHSSSMWHYRKDTAFDYPITYDYERDKVQHAVWWNTSHLLNKRANRWFIKSLRHSSCS